MLTVTQAFAYSSKEELALQLSSGHQEKLFELDGESAQIFELPAEDVNTLNCQLPEQKASRPNKASRAFRHTQLAVNHFFQRRHRADAAPRRDGKNGNGRLPLPLIQLILARLDIRDAAREDDGQATYQAHPAARPCPTSADDLYDRLVYSRAVARRESSPSSLALRLLGCCDPAARYDPCVTRGELSQLLEPVVADMRAALNYLEAFQSRLDLKTEGCDYWLDLSQVRTCVFRLTGYWPHDVEHDLEAWAFGLPEDLARLLYPQGGRFDHRDMAMNLDEVIIGPAWEKLAGLESTIRLHQRYRS